MKALCKEIGTRQPLTDQNFCNFYSVVLHRNMYDYADSHFYVWHPTAVGNGSPFRVPLRFISTSVIPETDGFFPLLPARLLNKPYWISEWDFCDANRFNVEGSFLVGAYSAAQDCTTLLRFCSRDGFGTQNHKRIPMIFFDGTNPMLNLGERAASLLFLRGDVALSIALPKIDAQNINNLDGYIEKRFAEYLKMGFDGVNSINLKYAELKAGNPLKKAINGLARRIAPGAVVKSKSK